MHGENTRSDTLAAIERFLFRLKDLSKSQTGTSGAFAAAHILSSLLGNGILVPVEDGELILGGYQNFLLLAMDGPKERKIRIELFGSGGEGS